MFRSLIQLHPEAEIICEGTLIIPCENNFYVPNSERPNWYFMVDYKIDLENYNLEH